MNLTDIITHTTAMFSAGTVSSYIALAFVAVFAVLTLIDAIKGFTRGFSRQLIRFLTIAASIVIAYFSALALNSSIIGYFEGKTVEECIEALGLGMAVESLGSPLAQILQAIDAAILQQLISLPMATIVSPMLFLIIFVIVSVLMLIVHAIVSGALGFSKTKNNIFTRLLGFVLGAAQGVAVAVIMLIPISGVINICENVVGELEEPETDAEKTIVSAYDTYIKDSAESPVLALVDTLGGDFLCSKLSTIEFEGEDKDVREEFVVVFGIYSDASRLAGADMASLTPENQAAIRSIIARVGEDRFMATFVSGVVSTTASLIVDKTLPLKDVEEPFRSLLESTFEVLTTDNADTIRQDMTTIVNVYFILSDSGVLAHVEEEGGDTFEDLLVERDENGDTIVNKIIDEFSANERTKGLVTQLTKLSLSLMMGNNEMDAATEETYENMKTGLNDVISVTNGEYASDEERKAAVSDALNTTLQDNGIELEKEVVDSMADYVDENYKGKEELTEEEFNDVIFSYYDAYVNYLENGTVPDDIPADLIPGGEGDNTAPDANAPTEPEGSDEAPEAAA